MELKEEYKNTDIGVLPEEWNPKSYGDIFQFLSTASFSREQLSDDEDIKCVHYGDIHTKLNHFIDFQEGYSSSIDYEKGKRYPFLKDGDIIMADASEDYSGVGKSVEVKNLGSQLAISGLHTILLRDKNNEFVDGFRGYIHTIHPVKKSLDRLATGLKVYSVSKGNLKAILIPVPPKPEQQAIATALSDIDTLITNLDKLIAKKKAIKQGAMQQLLKAPDKGGKRLPGFEGEWIEVGLSNLLKGNPQYGINAPAVEFNENLPLYLRITDISDSGEYIKTGKVSVSHKDYEHFILKEGELVFARTGASVGKTYLYNSKDGLLVYAGFLIKVTPDPKKLNPKYLKAFTQTKTYWHWVTIMSMRSGQPGINGYEYGSLLVPIPPTIEEQNSIAELLSDMDSEIDSLESKKSKYLLIKQGMMQELLTGKTRLV